MKKSDLDKDELAMLHSFERGEWKLVRNQKAEIARHKRYAQNTLRKDRRVNIRISVKVLEAIQAMAVEDGIPYQTLMGSVLHRYASGRLMEAPGRIRYSAERREARHP